MRGIEASDVVFVNREVHQLLILQHRGDNNYYILVLHKHVHAIYHLVVCCSCESSTYGLQSFNVYVMLLIDAAFIVGSRFLDLLRACMNMDMKDRLKVLTGNLCIIAQVSLSLGTFKYMNIT